MSTLQLNDSLFNNISTKCFLTSDDTSASLLVYSIFLLSNFVVGLPANIWVVWLFCNGTREPLASEIYFLILACCETLYCLGLPAQLYCMFSFENLSPGLNNLLVLQSYLVWLCRPVLQSCVCLERYVAVVHPLTFIRLKALKYKVAHCALAWCFILFIIMLFWTLPEEVTYSVKCVMFVLLTCIFFFGYFLVLHSLKRAGPGDRKGEVKQRKTGDQIKRKAFNTISVNLLCIVFGYFPAMMTRFLAGQISISMIVFDLTTGLSLVCGNIQPILYLRRAGKLSFLNKEPTFRFNGQK